jgi:hypothetical protein
MVCVSVVCSPERSAAATLFIGAATGHRCTATAVSSSIRLIVRSFFEPHTYTPRRSKIACCVHPYARTVLYPAYMYYAHVHMHACMERVVCTPTLAPPFFKKPTTRSFESGRALWGRRPPTAHFRSGRRRSARSSGTLPSTIRSLQSNSSGSPPRATATGASRGRCSHARCGS